MKALIYAALAAGVLAGPTISFAQETTAPLTRAEVRAELVRLESVGYRPGLKNVHYPADLEAAQARLRAQDNAAKGTMSSGG